MEGRTIYHIVERMQLPDCPTSICAFHKLCLFEETDNRLMPQPCWSGVGAFLSRLSRRTSMSLRPTARSSSITRSYIELVWVSMMAPGCASLTMVGSKGDQSVLGRIYLGIQEVYRAGSSHGASLSTLQEFTPHMIDSIVHLAGGNHRMDWRLFVAPGAPYEVGCLLR